MKNYKKVTSLLLASALLVTSMTACGSSKEEGADQAKGDTFIIGGIGPITGDTAAYGSAVKNGIQLAVDEINEAGGIAGKQIYISLKTMRIIRKNQ